MNLGVKLRISRYKSIVCFIGSQRQILTEEAKQFKCSYNDVFLIRSFSWFYRNTVHCIYPHCLSRPQISQYISCDKERCEPKILANQDLFSLCNVFRLTEICPKPFGFTDRIAFFRGRVVGRVGIFFLWSTWRFDVCCHFEKRTNRWPQTAFSLTEKQGWMRVIVGVGAQILIRTLLNDIYNIKELQFSYKDI